MTIAVTGATGQLGHKIIEKLTAKGITPIALARSPEKVADLGVETRAFDYENATALPEALAGVDTLMLVSSNEIGRRTPQHKNIIAAAKATGVKYIVYTSLLRTDTSTLSLAKEHHETEIALAESGLDFTILRNGWYTENYTSSAPGAIENGAFAGSAGDGAIASAARDDYAEAAVKVLTTEGHVGKTYELAGDTSYTLSDLAAELSKQTGKDIPYADMPEEEYAGVLAGAGFPEPMAKFFAGFDTSAKGGALDDDGKVLSTLIGRPTTPLADSVKAAIA